MRILIILLSLVGDCLADTGLKAYVEANLPHQDTIQYNVKRIEWDNQSYWIKQPDLHKGWLSILGKKIGRFLAPDTVIAPSVISNDTILDVEARRLKECEQKQGACARLIMQGDNWLLISDAGSSFQNFIKSLPVNQRIPYLIKGLDAVLNLHKHHVVQGRASIRDLVINEDEDLTFIDLAEDPESFMSFDEARARDLLNYFLTTVVYLQNDDKLEHEYTNLFMGKFPHDIYPILQRVIQNTSWLGTIAHTISSFTPHDVRKFARTHQLLRRHLNQEDLIKSH